MGFFAKVAKQASPAPNAFIPASVLAAQKRAAMNVQQPAKAVAPAQTIQKSAAPATQSAPVAQKAVTATTTPAPVQFAGRQIAQAATPVETPEQKIAKLNAEIQKTMGSHNVGYDPGGAITKLTAERDAAVQSTKTPEQLAEEEAKLKIKKQSEPNPLWQF